MIGKWRSSDGNAIGIGSEHEVEESADGTAGTLVKIRAGDVVGNMSGGEVIW